MDNEELSVNVETAAEPEREIDWTITDQGETSLEWLLYVLGIE